MKNYTLTAALLVCFFMLSHLSAQTVFPDNGIWKQKYHSIAWGHGGEVLWDYTTYTNYEIQEDTIINTVSYSKLLKNGVFSNLMINEGLKVLCGTHPDSLRTLFDFGLNPGDSFQFYGPSYVYGNADLKRIVLSTDSVMIGGETRKRIQFSNFPSYGKGPLWISGIGDINFGGIELDYSYVSWGNNTTSLLCFSSNGSNIYGNCTVGLKEIKHQANVFPNPAIDFVTIAQSSDMLPAKIQVYSLGGTMLQEKYADQEETFLDVSGLGSGIYILKINGKKGISHLKLTIR